MLGFKCQTIVNFGKMNNGRLYDRKFCTFTCFICRNSLKMALIIFHKWLTQFFFFVKKIQILCTWDHPRLFKFCQLVVKVISKELQTVFWNSTFSYNNGNMKDLEHKTRVKSWCWNRVFLVTVAIPFVIS